MWITGLLIAPSLELQDVMRTWRLPCAPTATPDFPLASTVQQRGLCLMTIEFLTQFPAAECVVTSSSLPFWDTVFDLFPKTFFQVFCSPPEAQPRPNVLRHNARFDSELAARFGARGAPYNLLFTMEDMESQMVIYLRGSPTAALLLMTQPEQQYLQGDLVYPIYCSPYSGFCGLVPALRHSGSSTAEGYAGYYAAMLDFHARARYPGSCYDRAAEDQILLTYAHGIAGVSAGTAPLLAEMTRNSLPPLEGMDLVFWEPPPQRQPTPTDVCALHMQITANDLESLLSAAMQA